MTDDRKDEAPAGSAEEWPKRAPPTIDLDASEVSGDTQAASKVSQGTDTAPGGLLPKLAPPLSGAVAALLVLAAFWAGGVIGPAQQPAQPTVSVSQFDNVAANVGDLSARIARVEAAATKAPAPATDPSLASRTEAIEKSLVAVREEAARLNTQLRAVTASVSELKAQQGNGSAAAAAPDLGPLTARLAQLEDATRALSSDVRKPGGASDVTARRLLLATALEASVRRGEPFAPALAAAKQVALDPNVLSPLEPFATRGIPPEQTYLREIVPVLQRIADAGAAKMAPVEADKPNGGSILDKLKSGVTNFVRLERDTGEATAALSPAAAERSLRRDDLAAARSEIASLPQASDPQVQAWLKSVDARAAALGAAQKFSAEALAAYGKSGQ